MALSDVEPPVFVDSLPIKITQSTDPGAATATVIWTAPTVTDNSGEASVSSDHQSGDSFMIGTTTVTFTVVDTYGNSNTVYFDVIIRGLLLITHIYFDNF